MANAEQTANGKLDGRDPDSPNYIPLPWTGVSLYRDVALGESGVTRPAGADPGKKPGEQWWTTSHLDKTTALAEILTLKYHGQTLFDMVSALFAIQVEGKSPEEVRKALGI